jgi:hypothetical protein
MPFALDTSQRSIVYTRPAITRAPTDAEGAGQRTGEPFQNEQAEPFSLAQIVVYPDAAGTAAAPRVAAVSRTDGIALGRLDMLGQVTEFATEADFAAIYLKDFRASGSSTPPTTVDFLASTLAEMFRWQKTENAKET